MIFAESTVINKLRSAIEYHVIDLNGVDHIFWSIASANAKFPGAFDPHLDNEE